MGSNVTEYLLDTNIIIYFLSGNIPKNELDKIKEIIKSSFNISAIIKIEFLGWGKFSDEEFNKAESFIRKAKVLLLQDEIITKTIELKREYNIKLADAVISAICLINDYTLITRNQDDFKNIIDVSIYNPFR